MSMVKYFEGNESDLVSNFESSLIVFWIVTVIYLDLICIRGASVCLREVLFATEC